MLRWHDLLLQLNTELMDEMAERLDWDDIPDTVMVLSDLSVDLRYNPQDCLNELKVSWLKRL